MAQVTLRATGMVKNQKILNWVAAVCNWVYRHVDRVVVLSSGFKHLLVERGVASEKLEVIYNWADEKSLETPTGQLPSAFPGSDKFRIVFAGNMGKAQALDAVLDAAAVLQSKGSQVCFVMIGGGVEVDRLKARAITLMLNSIVFLPPVSMAEVGTLLHAADALLVHLRRDPLFKITIPSKTQAYMAVGKPLVMAVDGDAADLVLLSGGGLVAESENSESLVVAIEALQDLSKDERQEMGKRAQSFYMDHLSLSVGVGKFAKIFNDI
ncbi:MAG: glycosyltransferase family 4 protein [Rhodoferax sp.]